MKIRTDKRERDMTRPSRVGRLHLTVTLLLCSSLRCHAVGLSDLLDRASQLSDKLHALSTSLTSDLDTHFPTMGRIMMPHPSTCHTSSLQTPNDKDQVLSVPESELLSLIRSLLLSWNDPLLLLALEAPTLAHPSNSAIYSKTKELQDNTHSLSAGLEHLTHKIGSSNSFTPCRSKEATSVKTTPPGSSTSTSCYPASEGTPTKLTASSRFSDAELQNYDQRHAEGGRMWPKASPAPLGR